MIQKEKDLLFKDLCARLPYGVVVELDEKFGFNKGTHTLVKELLDSYCVEGIKPYLRPMSSMSKEEKNYISEKCGFSIAGPIRNECELIMPVLAADWLIDFYNERHFDYRGLIEKGLAIETPEDMYK